MKKSLLQIIKEEVSQFYNDWQINDEPSIADKYFEKISGQQTQQPEKPQVDGELIGYVTHAWTQKLSAPIPIYKNPRSLNGIGTEARGILVASGDLYLAPSYNAMHDNILELLSGKGIVPVGKVYHYWEKYPEEFIAVQRVFNTNTFAQSVAYDEFPPQYDEIFRIAGQKQPFQFKPINHDNNPNDDDIQEMESPLDPNYQISYRPEGYVDNNLYESNAKKNK